MNALIVRDTIARARELAYAAGVPLRDRWGYAASDEDVLALFDLVRANPDPMTAGEAIGLANALGDIQLCGECEMLGTQEEMRLVAALQPLVHLREAP